MAPPPPPPPPPPKGAKLRQSSIHSFLLPHQNPPTPYPAAAAADDYERLRRETIGRNREFLRKLGIAAAAAADSNPNPNPNPNPSKRPKKPPPPSLPLRRSTRKRRPRPPPSSPSDAEDEPSSVDSSVYRYSCRADAPLPDPSPSSPSQNPNPPIAGFRIVGKAFRDPSLARIYSLDVFSFDEDRFLIAAGGHGGFISVYGGSGVGDNHVVEDDSDGDKQEMETELPPTSWKGSGTWISGVRFAEGNPTLLLSSSNDGGIVVWDIKPSASSSRPPPPVVAKSTAGLHSGGIFAMDRFGCSIATASKDSSVGFSTLTPAGDLVAVRSISGHHSGVIRGVCFREENTVADCGADGRICVLDTRSPHPCTLTVKMQHTTGIINTVEWCKLDHSLLLSASKDQTLHLFDVRNPSRPLHVLQGHVESGTGSCRQICRPCFVDGGKAVATPGQGSRKISLFDVGKGKMISQGIIGFDANLLTFTTHAEQQRLWAAGRYINQLRPLLHRC